MRNPRNKQINICVSEAEFKRLHRMAKKESGGNVSKLVRGKIFPAKAEQPAEQTRVGVPVSGLCAMDHAEWQWSSEELSLPLAERSHAAMCPQRVGGECLCGVADAQIAEDETDDKCDYCGWSKVNGECLNTDCPEIDGGGEQDES